MHEEEQQNAGCDLRAFDFSRFLILVLAILTRFLPRTGGIIIAQNEKRN
jgi:hypothetical protein